MKTRVAIACLMLATASMAAAGTIAGTVRAKGAVESTDSSGDGAYGSRRYKFVERIDYDQLQDFVVSIDQPVSATATTGSSANQPKIVQRDASFVPHVLPIAVGTGVRWPNEDDIYHNVFSMSDTKEFNLGLYGKEKVPVIVFDKVGRVDVFCGIHTQMHCIILVLPCPFFALADSHGHYVIRNVPAGTYRLKAWQERMPGQTREITVPENGEVKADFVLQLTELPKY
jgi:plastocyanin